MDLTDPKNIRRLNHLTKTQDAAEMMADAAADPFVSAPLQIEMQDLLTLCQDEPKAFTDIKFGLDMLDRIKGALLTGLPNDSIGEKDEDGKPVHPRLTVRQWLEARDETMGDGLPMAHFRALPVSATLANGKRFMSDKNIERYEKQIKALAVGVAHGIKDKDVVDAMHPKAYEWFTAQIPLEHQPAMNEGQDCHYFVWHGHLKSAYHDGLEEGVKIHYGDDAFPKHIPPGMKTNFFRDNFSCVIWY